MFDLSSLVLRIRFGQWFLIEFDVGAASRNEILGDLGRIDGPVFFWLQYIIDINCNASFISDTLNLNWLILNY